MSLRRASDAKTTKKKVLEAPLNNSLKITEIFRSHSRGSQTLRRFTEVKNTAAG
jgi:hypothetical protein